MERLQERFDVFMQFSEQQLIKADTVIHLFTNEGLFLSSTSSIERKSSTWSLRSLLMPNRKLVAVQTEYDPSHAFLLRYQVAQLMVDLTQLEYGETELIDHLRIMLTKAKSRLQVYFHSDDRRAAQFNYTLSRFTYLVFSKWILSDSPELNQMLTDLEADLSVEEYLPSIDSLSASSPHSASELSAGHSDNQLTSDSDEEIQVDSMDWSSRYLTNQAVGSESGLHSLFQNEITAYTDEVDEYPVEILSGLLPDLEQVSDEVILDEVVSNNQLNTYSRNQYLDRLVLPDSEMLSSLPTRQVKVCPECFGRSLVERKRPVNDMTTYCQTCRTRVETVYGPYYYQSYTANPAVAISRHRQFLVNQLRTRYFASEVSVVAKPTVQPVKVPASKAYFFSIASIDEETYKGLEAKYNEFLADTTHRVSTNRVTPDRVSIQICSLGGNVFQAKRMIALINSHKNYTTVIGDVLYSAAFRLYFSLYCPKSLASHAIGLFHLARTVEYVLESGKVVDWQAQNQSDESLAFCRSVGLNDQQIATIADGGDVYLDRYDLERLGQVRTGILTQL